MNYTCTGQEARTKIEERQHLLRKLRQSLVSNGQFRWLY